MLRSQYIYLCYTCVCTCMRPYVHIHTCTYIPCFHTCYATCFLQLPSNYLRGSISCGWGAIIFKTRPCFHHQVLIIGMVFQLPGNEGPLAAHRNDGLWRKICCAIRCFGCGCGNVFPDLIQSKNLILKQSIIAFIKTSHCNQDPIVLKDPCIKTTVTDSNTNRHTVSTKALATGPSVLQQLHISNTGCTLTDM